MSRPLRLEFVNALYHVTSRGDRREDNYLLELARYVALNPVRAGVVQEAKDWPLTNLSGRREVHRQNELAGGTKTDWPRNQRERLAPGDSKRPAQAAANGAGGF